MHKDIDIVLTPKQACIASELKKIVSEKAFAILVECYYYYLKFHNHDVHDVLNNLKKIKGFIDNYPISQDVKIKIYDEQYAKVINKIDKESCIN